MKSWSDFCSSEPPPRLLSKVILPKLPFFNAWRSLSSAHFSSFRIALSERSQTSTGSARDKQTQVP